MIKEIISKKQLKEVRIGSVFPGVLVTGVATNPNQIYIKIDKTNSKCHRFIEWDEDPCLLMNIKHGAIRCIHKNDMVLVLEGKLIINEPESLVGFIGG